MSIGDGTSCQTKIRVTLVLSDVTGLDDPTSNAFATFVEDFKTQMANKLGVSRNRIVVEVVTPTPAASRRQRLLQTAGSVRVDFAVLPSTDAANDGGAVTATTLQQRLAAAIASGDAYLVGSALGTVQPAGECGNNQWY